LLTIRDVTREVRLDARHVPHTTEPGRPRHIIDLTTVLDRRDFGLVWSSLTQKIADPVSITLHIELVPASSPA
jgi:polyisoprenoid-binding protein YceI